MPSVIACSSRFLIETTVPRICLLIRAKLLMAEPVGLVIDNGSFMMKAGFAGDDGISLYNFSLTILFIVSY